MKTEMISIQELIDIVGYAIGKGAGEKLSTHYRKYGDYARVKDLIIKQLVLNSYERLHDKEMIKKMREEMEERSEVPLPF